mmetsp:Transcript_11590/g.24890  ORF Transcript_11590/g.24890 Transcript_11590/m.24890 type:complete len:200 (-) Transcript_11590:25-624(-)
MQHILIEKVKVWASVSKGCFPVQQRLRKKEQDTHTGCAGANGAFAGHEDMEKSHFVRFSEIQDEDQALIKWCKVKSIMRSVEKVVRSYSQDVSRLLDLCRQAIVFDSAADICACIKAVREDSDALVVRVTNKLDPAFDAVSYGGYRDVAVNLRLTTPAAVTLGLDSHVCELQLLLSPFAKFKSEEGHKRYVTLRNLKGE